MMQATTILKAMAVAAAGVFVAACTDEATSPAPRETQLTAAPIVSTAPLPEPFAIRAPLDPFFVNQMPEMMFRSSIGTELIIQRLVTAPSPGSWHTHTGPAFSIVDQGTVIIHRYSKKYGCVATTYTAGDTYIEEAGEIHRAEVPQPATAVEYKARFYTQVGAPLSTPADDPCGTAG
jgi:hypothetical protein